MRLLTSFNVASDAMRQTVLPRVKVRVLLLFLRLELLKDLTLLLLSQFFAVDTGVFSLHGSESLSVLFLFHGSSLRWTLLLDLGRFDVVLGRLEINFNVRFNAANLIIGFGVDYINGVFAATILNVDRIALVKHGVMCQLLLKTSAIKNESKSTINQSMSVKSSTYMALGLDRSMKAVSWGLIFT